MAHIPHQHSHRFSAMVSPTSENKNENAQGGGARSQGGGGPPSRGWGSYLPGVGLSVTVATAGFEIAHHLGQGLLHLQGVQGAASPVSGIPVSILLGLALKNSGVLPATAWDRLNPGIKLCSKKALQVSDLLLAILLASDLALVQLGIVCVGAKLSAADLAAAGAVGLPCVAAGVASGLYLVPWLGARAGLPPRMSSLIGVGTSICGVTAISALSPAIKATDRETSVAIANVVAFGTLGMLTYPYVAHHFLATSHQCGLFLGIAVHDTSQCLGSALTYATVYADQKVVEIAAVTKLTRNLCLAFAVPMLTWRHAGRTAKATDSAWPALADLKKHVPGFVYGFVGMCLLRSLGDAALASPEGAALLGSFGAEEWRAAAAVVGDTMGSRWLLGTAMAAVGLGTSASALKGVGFRPFTVGMAGAAAVGATGMASALAVGAIL